jgi:hypothetical protein
LFAVFIVACAKTCGSNGNALGFMIYPCWGFRNFLILCSGMAALKWATIAKLFVPSLPSLNTGMRSITTFRSTTDRICYGGPIKL